MSAGGDLARDLVGLSLSGGGLRSACFNLGLLQAFHKAGLWKYFDYMSTVSGGGYIGAFLSSALVHRAKPYSRSEFPLKADADGKQCVRVQKFIYGGRYLLRAWQLANDYLIGLFFTNLAIFSGLIAVCSLIAFLWRCLDFPLFRDFAALVQWGRDLHAAFWPFALFTLAWLVSWAVSYGRRQAEAPGRAARWMLYFAVASLLIGCALLLGNGDIGGAEFLASLFGAESPEIPSGVGHALVGIVIGCLAPFLHPRRLLQSGIRPKRSWERYVFAAASIALLVGLPLVIIGLLARENVSGFNDDPYRPIVRGDIDNGSELAAVLSGKVLDPEADKVRQELLQRWPSLAVQGRDLASELHKQSSWNAYLHGEGRFTVSRVPHSIWRGFAVFVWICGHPSPAGECWRARKEVESTQEGICRVFNEQLLPDRAFLTWQLEMTKDGSASNTATTTPAAADTAQKRLEQPLKRARAIGVDRLLSHEVNQLNRLLLESRFPGVFRDRDEVRRVVTIWADQGTRLVWFVLAALIFLAAMWVDLNATAMHKFYRNRIAQAFIVSPKGKANGLALSAMATTDYGGPYHLISASIAMLTKRHYWDGSVPESASDDIEREQRLSDAFLFSNHYCGSQLTNYVRTEEYEKWICGDLNRIDLSEVTALSGAAVSPSQMTNWLIAFLMLALNLRLGQWLPNPLYGPPRFRPRLITLLASLLNQARRHRGEQPYCFVSDGGHSENLGLLQLLRRRCSLIIASDASCDPNHQFDDLARMIRLARIHGGVRLVEISNKLTAHPAEWRLDDLQHHSSHKSQDPTASHENDRDKLSTARSTNCKQHFVLARILYPDGQDGLLVYVKPSFDGDEGVDLLQYRERVKEFPHEPTSDQLFDDAQVEAYRHLGYHIGMKLCERIPDVAAGNDLWERGDVVSGRRLRDWFEGADKEPAASLAVIQATVPVSQLLRDRGATIKPRTPKPSRD